MVIKLTISYDGTNYCGWQVQPNGVTVQEKIEYALYSLVGEKISVTGSGRTDSGVHAQGQVASFVIENGVIPPEKYAPALNRYLPEDIKVIKSEKEKDDFNARFSAKEKTYVYRTYKSETALPLLERYAVRINNGVNVDLMKKGAKEIEGEHDFKCFLASDSSVKSTVRTVYEIRIEEKENLVEFYVTGNGFLYNMVRIIIGTLLAVGEGKITPNDVKNIIKSGNRSLAGKTLPSKGLTLLSVKY